MTELVLTGRDDDALGEWLEGLLAEVRRFCDDLETASRAGLVDGKYTIVWPYGKDFAYRMVTSVLAERGFLATLVPGAEGAEGRIEVTIDVRPDMPPGIDWGQAAQHAA